MHLPGAIFCPAVQWAARVSLQQSSRPQLQFSPRAAFRCCGDVSWALDLSICYLGLRLAGGIAPESVGTAWTSFCEALRCQLALGLLWSGMMPTDSASISPIVQVTVCKLL